MTDEPILDEIRRVRHATSSQIGHDPHQIVKYYDILQKKNSERIVNLGAKSNIEQSVRLLHGKSSA